MENSEDEETDEEDGCEVAQDVKDVDNGNDYFPNGDSTFENKEDDMEEEYKNQNEEPKMKEKSNISGNGSKKLSRKRKEHTSENVKKTGGKRKRVEPEANLSPRQTRASSRLMKII